MSKILFAIFKIHPHIQTGLITFLKISRRCSLIIIKKNIYNEIIIRLCYLLNFFLSSQKFLFLFIYFFILFHPCCCYLCSLCIISFSSPFHLALFHFLIFFVSSFLVPTSPMTLYVFQLLSRNSNDSEKK